SRAGASEGDLPRRSSADTERSLLLARAARPLCRSGGNTAPTYPLRPTDAEDAPVSSSPQTPRSFMLFSFVACLSRLAATTPHSYYIANGIFGNCYRAFLRSCKHQAANTNTLPRCDCAPFVSPPAGEVVGAALPPPPV